MNDDDYWNTSETKIKAFNFSDDALSPQEILTIGQTDNSVFNSTLNSAKSPLLPLSSLVSPKVLNLIVLAQSGKDLKGKQDTEPTVVITIKRLILGRSVCLQTYRSLKSKTELLDAAIAIGDGNAILTIVLFLIQTLNKKLVYEILSSRTLALNHYISFLRTEGKITELTDLLTMLGRSPEAAMYEFQHIVKTQKFNIDGLLKYLKNLNTNHFKQPHADSFQAEMLSDYIKLLETQISTNKSLLYNKSALESTSCLIADHWHEGPGTICDVLKVTPIQRDWLMLNVYAKAKKWKDVESLFIKKDWFGRTTVSSHVPIELLVWRLNLHSASTTFLATFLNKLLNLEQRLALAKKYEVHNVVIETLAKQKDRVALTNYKMILKPQSQEYMVAEITLHDRANQWKN